MIETRDIDLSEDSTFFSTPRRFEWKIDHAACQTIRYGRKKRKRARLVLDPDIAACLNRYAVAHPTIHDASLNDVSAAAMRFYQAGNGRIWPVTEYLDELFLLRRRFGLTFDINQSNSVARRGKLSSLYHSEAYRRESELFGYGVALSFTRAYLGVPIERFFFKPAGGQPSADFYARITLQELIAAGAQTRVLTPGGRIVRIEVKAVTGQKAFSDSKQSRRLLKSLAKKSEAVQGEGFVGVLVGIHAVSHDPTTSRGFTRIIVADPGEGLVLSDTAQLNIVLKEVLKGACQIGLWVVARDTLAWLRVIEAPLSNREEELHGRLQRRYAGVRTQPFVRPTPIDGRGYVGRIFNELTERIGHRGDRLMELEELQRRIAAADVGEFVYLGVDVQMADILRRQDVRGLLQYGVRTQTNADSPGGSAFVAVPAATTPARVRHVVEYATEQMRQW